MRRSREQALVPREHSELPGLATLERSASATSTQAQHLHSEQPDPPRQMGTEVEERKRSNSIDSMRVLHLQQKYIRT
eukprot:943107-Amphidinium_carterae.2